MEGFRDKWVTQETLWLTCARDSSSWAEIGAVGAGHRQKKGDQVGTPTVFQMLGGRQLGPGDTAGVWLVSGSRPHGASQAGHGM